MSKEFARAFYDSIAWKRTRKAYAASVGGLCERCLRAGRYVPGVIVHHINPLTPANITDETVALAWGNLELVCRDCHAEIHDAEINKRVPKRYRIDEIGRVIPL